MNDGTGFFRRLYSVSQTRLLAVLSACSLCALTGCISGPIAVAGPAAIEPVASLGHDGYSASLEGDYILRATDRISVVVFREEELSLADVPISADGRISLPLVGQLDVAGRTLPEVEAAIEQVLGARYLRNPDVAVNIIAYDSHKVTVEGSVETPGVFTFSPGLRLSGGISMAEGFTRVSDVNEVAVFRQTEDGMHVAKFDYAAVRLGVMMDPVLHPGDRIVVGTNNLSQFWQDMLKSMPVFGLFTRL